MIMATQVMPPPPMKLEHGDQSTAPALGPSGSPLSHAQSMDNLSNGGSATDDEVGFVL